MQRSFLVAGLLATTVSVACAQDVPTAGRVVSAGVFGLSANAGLQLEQRLGRHWSLGVQGARYFSADYPGYQAALLGRYYFRPTAPAGLYLQLQAGTFTHDGKVVSDYPGVSPVPYPTKVNGQGGGLGLGYQLALGRRLLLNAGLGLRLYLQHWGNYYCDCHYLGDFNAVGQPGSILDGQLSAGYSF